MRIVPFGLLSLMGSRTLRVCRTWKEREARHELECLETRLVSRQPRFYECTAHAEACSGVALAARSSAAARCGPKAERKHLHLRSGEDMAGCGCASYGLLSGHAPVKWRSSVPGGAKKSPGGL